LLREGGKWGFIDRTGRLVIPMRFDYVDRFSEGLALVSAGGERLYIDKRGKAVLTRESQGDDPKGWVSWAEGFSEGLALAYLIYTSVTDTRQVRVGFIDRTGRLAIEPQFHRAGAFSEGFAAVALRKKWGYVDLPPPRRGGGGERRGADVAPSTRWGYVDRKGRLVIKPQFAEAHKFSEGLAAVQKGEHWCYIDREGKVVIRGRFNEAKDFRGGLARVHEGGSYQEVHDGPSYWKGGAWFYINRKGEKVRRWRPDARE
jgi:hypothetical protein